MSKKGRIPVDNPIEDRDSDTLGRAGQAEYFASYITRHDVSSGLVVGLFGPWGSGKTSFINLANNSLREYSLDIVNFNPWMYSGTHQLVQKFFSEISQSIGDIEEREEGHEEEGHEEEERCEEENKVYKISGLIVEYAKLFTTTIPIEIVDNAAQIIDAVSLIASTLSVAQQVASRAKKQRSWFSWLRSKDEAEDAVEDEPEDEITNNPSKLRELINDRLAELEKPLVVVLDDIDRLQDSEIREIFTLIRLIANFPNIIYIVICDRFRVEQVFDNGKVSGRDYVQKIVQIPYDLPEVSRGILRNQVADLIGLIDDGGTIESDEHKKLRWHDVLNNIILPLVRNMRDFYKYKSAVSKAAIDLQDKVAAVDVLTLEAVRIFLPDTYRMIAENVDHLTVTYDPNQYKMGTPVPSENYQEEISRERSREVYEEISKNRVGKLCEAQGQEDRREEINEIIKAIVKYIFPPYSEPSYQYKSYFQGALWEVEQYRKKHVVHESILRYYLDRIENDDIKYADCAYKLSKSIHDKDIVNRYLKDPTFKPLPETILRFRYYEDYFVERFAHWPSGREFAVPSMINLWDTLIDASGISVVNEGLILDTIKMATLLIINAIDTVAQQTGDVLSVYSILPEVLVDISSLATKRELIKLAGEYTPVIDDPSLYKAVVHRIEDSLFGEISNDKNGDRIAEEWNIFKVMRFAQKFAHDNGISFDVPRSRKLAQAAYRQAKLEGLEEDEHIYEYYFRKIFDKYDASDGPESTEVSRYMMELVNKGDDS